MASSKDDDDEAFWGNEITVEEFDYLESQIPTEILPEAGHHCVPTANYCKRTKYDLKNLQEEQYIQDGQIKMLRDELAARSKELDQERLERDRILEDRLQLQRDKEIQLQRNIDRLHSDLKFKEQELRSANSKVLALEQRSKQSFPNVAAKTKSPDRTIPNNSKFSFNEKSVFVNKNTQTDNGKKISFHRSAALVDAPIVPDSSYIIPHVVVDKMATLTSRVNTQKKFPQTIRLVDKLIPKDVRETISLTHKGTNALNSLHLNCYCSVESENKYRYPEVGMLQQVQQYVEEYQRVVCKLYNVQDINILSSETGHCNHCKKRVCSISLSLESVPREVFSHTQTLMITAMNELINLMCVSKMTGKIILEKCKEASSNQKDWKSIPCEMSAVVKGSENTPLLMFLVSSAVPLFSCGDLLNKSVIEWVLTALHTLTTYSCLYCLKCFDVVVRNLCLNSMLDGTCGKEIAFLALKFLCRCLPCTFMESVLGHHSDPCLLGSIAKFYSQTVLMKDFTQDELHNFVLFLSHFLTGMATYHSSIVTIGSSTNCTCFSDLLEALISCMLLVSRRNVDKLVLRIGLHFLHLASKIFPRYRELRNRVENEYVMLICNASIQCKVEMELKDMLEIVHDLWDFRQDEGREFDKDETKAINHRK